MKIIKNVFKTILLTLLLAGCDNKEKSIPINNISLIDRDYYIKEALIKGDTNAYQNLNDYYMDYPIEGILYTALIMANKYEYHLAYLNVYEALTSQDHKKGVSELENLDKETRKMALNYLEKGAQKGNKECKYILGKHYIEGKYLKKDIKLGNQLILESKK